MKDDIEKDQVVEDYQIVKDQIMKDQIKKNYCMLAILIKILLENNYIHNLKSLGI